jgi:hypothetical protein
VYGSRSASQAGDATIQNPELEKRQQRGWDPIDAGRAAKPLEEPILTEAVSE